MSVYIFKEPVETNPYVIPQKTKNVRIVPKMPNIRMYPILSKNLFLLMLNPDAKIIGGRHT